MLKLRGPRFCPLKDCQTPHPEWKFRFWTPQTQKTHIHTLTHTVKTQTNCTNTHVWNIFSQQQCASSLAPLGPAPLRHHMISCYETKRKESSRLTLLSALLFWFRHGFDYYSILWFGSGLVWLDRKVYLSTLRTLPEDVFYQTYVALFPPKTPPAASSLIFASLPALTSDGPLKPLFLERSHCFTAAITHFTNCVSNVIMPDYMFASLELVCMSECERWSFCLCRSTCVCGARFC